VTDKNIDTSLLCYYATEFINAKKSFMI
jgi:hypothetical protein